MADAPGGPRADALERSYDETPYHDQHYPLFAVDRMLGQAQLFGLIEPGRTARGLRVLDLGCASAQHLRCEAALHPDAHFVGVDFSSAEVELGRKAVVEARLDNVELVVADLRSFEPQAGAFDLVVCHGVFSWVPDDVKQRILEVAREALAPSGVAAIAYLTYPGWKQREAVRELLTMRDRPGRAPLERVEDAARLLRVLHATYAAREDDPHARSLLAVVESMQKSSANGFLHDELGQTHDPCYFLQMVEWASECGLAYLAEADLGTMTTQSLAPADPLVLDALAPDALEAQQLVDFAVNRSGRSSFFVRNDAAPKTAIERETLERLHFATRWWNVTPLNADPGSAAVFEAPNGRRFETQSEPVQALLRVVAADRQRSWAWSELARESGLEGDEVATHIAPLILAGIVIPVPAPA